MTTRPGAPGLELTLVAPRLASGRTEGIEMFVFANSQDPRGRSRGCFDVSERRDHILETAGGRHRPTPSSSSIVMRTSGLVFSIPSMALGGVMP
jgi:hypothetical protein